MRKLTTIFDWLFAICYSLIIMTLILGVINLSLWECSLVRIDPYCSPVNTFEEEAFGLATGLFLLTLPAIIYRSTLPSLIRYTPALFIMQTVLAIILYEITNHTGPEFIARHIAIYLEWQAELWKIF